MQLRTKGGGDLEMWVICFRLIAKMRKSENRRLKAKA